MANDNIIFFKRKERKKKKEKKKRACCSIMYVDVLKLDCGYGINYDEKPSH